MTEWWQLETLLRRLLPNKVLPASPPKPVPTELESLLQHLLEGVQTPKPIPSPKTGFTDMETLLQARPAFGDTGRGSARARPASLYIGTG